MQEQLGRTTTVLQENLTGVRVVKAFSREPYEIDKFNSEAENLFRLELPPEPHPGAEQPLLPGDGHALAGGRALGSAP